MNAFVVVVVPVYMCMEAKRYLCRGGICLWRGQGDGEMTTEIMSL